MSIGLISEAEIQNRLWTVAMNSIFDKVVRIMAQTSSKVRVIGLAPELNGGGPIDVAYDQRPLAFTNGIEVFVNVQKLARTLTRPGMDRTRLMHAYRGLVYHELGHVMFTLFGAARTNMIQRATNTVNKTGRLTHLNHASDEPSVMHQLWALIEEGREEYFLINKWPRMANYLRWLFVFEMKSQGWTDALNKRQKVDKVGALTSMLLLTWGRSYLPKRLRLATLRDWCLEVGLPSSTSGMRSHAGLRRFLNAIKAYSTSVAFDSNTGNANDPELTEVANSLIDLLGIQSWSQLQYMLNCAPDVAKAKTPQPGITAPRPGMQDDPGTDGDDSGETEDDDIADEDGDGNANGKGESDGDADDGKGKGEGKGKPDSKSDDGGGKGESDDDANGEADGKGSSSVGKGKGKRDAVPKGRLEDELTKALRDIEDDDEVVTETREFVKQIGSALDQPGILLPADREWRSRNQPITPKMMEVRHKLKMSFAPLVEKVDAYWDSQVSDGRLNVRHVVASQHRSFEVFDRWVPDLEDESSFEVVVACDLSGSMGGTGASNVSQALWTIKKMCDDLNQPCTTMLYDESMAYGYTNAAPAAEGSYQHYGSDGGTDPTSTIFNASVILRNSKRKHRLFVMMTDGAWGIRRNSTDGKVLFDSMKALKDAGVSSSLAVYGDLAIIRGYDAAMYDFGSAFSIRSLDDMVALTANFIRERMAMVVHQ